MKSDRHFMKPGIEPWVQKQPYNDIRQISQKIAHIQSPHSSD